MDITPQVKLLLTLVMAVREKNEPATRQLLRECSEEYESRTAKSVVRKLDRMLARDHRDWFMNRIVAKKGASV